MTHHGMNLRAALKRCRELNIPVRQVKKTGELKILLRGRWEKINARKKVAPRVLTVALLKKEQ